MTQGPKGCSTGKYRYHTEYEAQCALVSAIIARNRGRNERKETRWYACQKCGGFHLTSKEYRKE